MKSTASVEPMIRVIRGQKVILDADLARVYGVPTKRLNEQVRRNRTKFPSDFMFRLDPKEKDEVVAICDHLASLRFSHVLPMAFTEHGAMMAANVLNSRKATEMSVFVIRAFVKMREALSATQTMEKRLAEVEKTLLIHDTTLWELYERIKPLLLPPPEAPKRRIGFRTEDAKR